MLFTLGHSTLSADEFVKAARGIDVIIDVRSHPGSNRHPQFNKEEMERWLEHNYIGYEWWPELGGWTQEHLHYAPAMTSVGVDVAAYASRSFPKHRIGIDRPANQLNPTGASGEAPRPTWTNQGLYDYAWYMSTPEFLTGMDRLIATYGGEDQPRVALTCAEALWWRCHRSMIADYLCYRQVPVFHLPTKPPVRETTPRFKPHPVGDRLERYPVEVLAAWVFHLISHPRSALTWPESRQPVSTDT